jgi:hypothetical protein
MSELYDLSFGSENVSRNDANIDEAIDTPSITKCILLGSSISKNRTPQPEISDINEILDISDVSMSMTPLAAEHKTPEISTISEESRHKQSEENASERLAWELMQQEQTDLYNIQMKYMQSQAGIMSEDDYAALQQVLREAGAVALDDEQVLENGDSDEQELDDEGDEEEEWDYERLLALGQALGGESSCLQPPQHMMLNKCDVVRCKDRKMAHAFTEDH